MGRLRQLSSTLGTFRFEVPQCPRRTRQLSVYLHVNFLRETTLIWEALRRLLEDFGGYLGFARR